MDIQEFRSAIQAKGAVIAQKTRVVEEARIAYLSAIKELEEATGTLDISVNEYINTSDNTTREGLLKMKEAFAEQVSTFNFKLNTYHDDIVKASELANLRMFCLVSKCCNPLWGILGERN